MSRALRDRLKFDLARNRAELEQVVEHIDDLDYAPKLGMKTYRDQIVEIGAMEAESVALLRTGSVPDWKFLESHVEGSTVEELLTSLSEIRSDLFGYLDSIGDDELSRPVDVPKEWAPFVGDTELEREELFRWLGRHEYYHLGQIITYRWVQGFNPYKTGNAGA
jgi:hypothetical protein